MIEEPLHVVFEPLHEDVVLPQRHTAESAGFDLHAYLRDRTIRVVSGATGEEGGVYSEGLLQLEPGDVALVPTGFRARLPAGHEAQIRMRSSMAFRRGLILPNAPGTIDADYPDEWLIMTKNDSPRAVVLEHGERVAQAIVIRVATPEWVRGVVDRSTDRVGGLGSTGSG